MSTSGWLLRDGDVRASVFRLDRYCNEWKASTYPYGKPSFHIVLEGEFWLELFNLHPRALLEKGDILFFFKTLPFLLTSSSDTNINDIRREKMLTIEEPAAELTDLLCGFLQPQSISSQLLFALLPDIILIKNGDSLNSKLHLLFELLQTEINLSHDENNIIIPHLTDAILHYILSNSSSLYKIDTNLLNAVNDEPLAKLIIAIIDNPEHSWSLDEMARFVHMSRSTFNRRVLKVTSYTPNKLLSKLRIYVALNLLRRGIKIEDIYKHVGYESISGFYYAFKRVTGAAPSDYIAFIN